MAFEVSRRSSGALTYLDDRRLSREVSRAQVPAKVAAARIQAAAFAAHTGLVCTEILTSLEVQAVQRQGAVLDARARAIVDTYTGVVTTELSKLALRS
jgi:hypothetical protein